MASTVADQPVRPTTRRARIFMLVALVIVPVNVGVFLLAVPAVVPNSVEPEERALAGPLLVSFSVLALVQLVCGIAAVATGLRERRATQGARGLWPAILGGLAALGAPVGWLLGCYGMMEMAAALYIGH